MDFKALLAGLLAMTVALAGCSDDGDKGPSPEEACDGIFADGTCTPHTEPSIVLDGLPETVPAYSVVPFTWALDNGTRGTSANPVHSMDSRVIANTEATLPTNQSAPDDFGTEVAKQEHKNLPDSFEAEFSWPNAGETLNLWGYMLIEGVHTWNSLGQVTVTDVVPTGNVTMITIQQGPPPAVDNNDVTLGVGDAVQFANELPVPTLMDYTITFTCDVGTVPDLSVPAGGESDAIDFLFPTRCTYVGNSAASATGEDPAAVSGTVRIVAA